MLKNNLTKQGSQVNWQENVLGIYDFANDAV